MSNPQNFMFGPPAGAYAAPLVSFSGVADLPQRYFQGRAMNAFSEGIPKDAGGRPDFNAILDQGARAGGVDFLKGVLPYIYLSGSNLTADGGGRTQQLLNPGGQADQPTVAGDAHPAGASPSNIVPQPSAAAAGELPPGEGSQQRPYQVSSRPQYDQIEKGAWYQVKGQVPQIKGQEGKPPSLAKAHAPESGQPTAGPENAARGSSPDERAASGGATSGAPAPVEAPQRYMGEWPKDFAFAPRAAQPAAKQPAATSPGPIAAPPPAVTQPQPSPQPQPAPAAQPTGRQPLPSIDPAAGNKEIAARERRIGELREQASIERNKPKILGRENAAADLEAQAKHLEEINSKQAEILRKPYEKENEAHAAGFRNAREYEQYKEADKKAADAGEKQKSAIDGAAFTMGADLLPHIANGKALLNAPGLYTGYGAETSLEFNRAKQIFGDKNAAVQQEAFQKTSAAMQTGLANMQRFMAGMGGQPSSRIFAHQINLIEKSSASIGNTVAGNRFLLENSDRLSKAIFQIQRMATDYLSNHPYLDATFNQKVSDFMQSNPLMTDREAENPAKFLSAPEVPKGLKGDALIKWQHDMRLKEGDPVRLSDGSRKYFKALTPKREP